MVRSSLMVVPCLWMAGVLAHAGCTDWGAYQVSPGAPSSSSGAGTGGTAPTSGPSGGAGGQGGGGGGEALPARCGRISLLADDFTPTNSMAVWEPNGTISIAEGEAVAKIPAGSPVEIWNFLTSQYFYDLRGDALSIEVKSIADPKAPVSTYLKLYYNDGNYAEITQEASMISFTKSVLGKWSSVGEKPYDATAHRFWRFREDSGLLSWETSADGVAWTLQASSSNVMDLSSVKVEFGIGAGENQAASGEAHFDNVNGGTPKGGWCKASSLKDDFEDAKLDHDWTRGYFDDACEHLESGELIFKVAQGTSGGCSYRSASAVDLTGDTLAVKVPLGPDPATDGEAVFEAYIESAVEQSIEFVLQGGQLSCLTRLDDSFQVVNDVPYDAAVHRFWRLREAAGQTFWETSADGQAWNAVAQMPTPFPLTALTVRLSGNSWNKEALPVEAHFDNVNMP